MCGCVVFVVVGFGFGCFFFVLFFVLFLFFVRFVSDHQKTCLVLFRVSCKVHVRPS